LVFEKSGLLIKNLNLVIGRKDRIAIIGKNGKGKTTLLNLLAGELMPLQGVVTPHPATNSLISARPT